MSYETITVEQQGPAALIRFNRPRQRNAISRQSFEDLLVALAAADADSAVRGVIITGDAKVFSAGADLNDALALDSAEAALAYFRCWHRLCSAVEELSKPTIAAIEGYCMTGGLEIALACDLRVASQSASFAITSSRIGTVAAAGGTQRLPRIVGRAHALDIMLSGEPFSAEHAYRIGLVNRLLPDGGVLAEAQRMVDMYAQRAPLSLAFIKRAIYRGMDMDLTSAIEFETYLCATIYGTADRREGIGAFLEKRPPQFKGK